MIGTVTNVVVASAAPNVKKNVKTTEVNLYTEKWREDETKIWQEDETKTSVDIPVGATNLEAAIIIANSSVMRNIRPYASTRIIHTWYPILNSKGQGNYY